MEIIFAVIAIVALVFFWRRYSKGQRNKKFVAQHKETLDLYQLSMSRRLAL